MHVAQLCSLYSSKAGLDMNCAWLDVNVAALANHTANKVKYVLNSPSPLKFALLLEQHLFVG